MAGPWTQLTGLSRTGDLREGLRVPIADPLWMLSRQRQLGGFQGEDAASPVRIAVTHGATAVNRFVDSAGQAETLDPDLAPEIAAEAEPVLSGVAAARHSAEAALRLLSSLPESLRARALRAFQDGFPLRAGTDTDRLMRLLVRKGFDGTRLAAADDAALARLLNGITTVASERTALEKAFTAWRDATGRRFVEPPKSRRTWDRSRFEYQFGLAAEEVDARLGAGGFPGGRFDWFSVELGSPSGRAFTDSPRRRETQHLVPTRVRYPGMPAARHWDFEDGASFYGGLEADATDLPQLILVEFATVYSDDWYQVPVRVPTGCLVRVIEVEVTDTFGGTRTIPAAAVADGPTRSWRFFELAGDRSPDQGKAPWLYVPRVTEGAHQGEPVERVLVMRDEAANLAWAVELLVETPAGRPRDRRNQWLTSVPPAEASEPAAPAEDRPWSYRLSSAPPPYWVPFLPVVDDNRPTGMLRRARMVEWELLGDRMRELAGPQALVTVPETPLEVHDESLPEGGLELTRAYQLGRDPAGRPRLWMGRRKRPAGSVRTSGWGTDLLLDAEGRPVDRGNGR